MRVDGKRVLVIGGAGGGIGRAITRAYGSAGAAVAVADIDSQAAEEAVGELTAEGYEAWPLSGDVRVLPEVEGMVTAAAHALGGLDVLVTVVGGQVAFVPAVRLHDMLDEDWDTIYELNLRYVARAVRTALRVFLEQGTGGSIVSVGSVTGFMAASQQAAYGVAKASLLSLARTVASEYSADGIRMNVVAVARSAHLWPTRPRTIPGSPRSRSAGTAPSARSPPQPSTWPRTRRRTSPGSRSWSMVASRCEGRSTGDDR
jgi:3-oxoacyl-[acyl-carrier protein] reductase